MDCTGGGQGPVVGFVDMVMNFGVSSTYVDHASHRSLDI